MLSLSLFLSFSFPLPFSFRPTPPLCGFMGFSVSVCINMQNMESHQAALCILHIRFEWESNGNSDNGSNSSSTTTFSRMCLLAQVYVTFSPDWTMGYFVKFSANSMICGDFIKYLNGSRIGSKWKTGGKGKALPTPFLHCRMFLVLCMVECLKLVRLI